MTNCLESTLFTHAEAEKEGKEEEGKEEEEEEKEEKEERKNQGKSKPVRERSSART